MAREPHECLLVLLHVHVVTPTHIAEAVIPIHHTQWVTEHKGKGTYEDLMRKKFNRIK